MQSTPENHQPGCRWLRRKEARPGEIMDAALAVFIEKGYAGTKMEDIARQAGVTKGTPYLYFQNKEELFREIIKSAIQPRLDEVQSYIDASADHSLQQQLQNIADHWRQTVLETPRSGILKLMMAEAGNFPDVAAYYDTHVIQRFHQQLIHLLETGMARDEIRRLDPVYAAHIIIAPMLYSVMHKHCFAQQNQQTRLDSQLLFQQALDILFNGLRATDIQTHHG
ncbi:TetR/AcrR family transcriptional regulator [Leeia sp.]|uniref:TetR/AcrR family transcriptional regulator n=1 Tax=Leeia sp. TaxID=2884678 RepID=UPI0035AF6B07